MHWIQLIFFGFCIGTADLVPGISGGTMAFILGIYEELIHSISSLKPSSLFSRTSFWQFLFPLLLGISSAFILMAHWVQSVLQHDDYKLYLYAGFLGLILASIYFCSRQIKKWDITYGVTLSIGVCLGYILTSNFSIHYDQNALWLILCGTVAIAAMLLPGISGSYMLTILGVYPLAIGSLVDFTSGLKSFTWESHAFSILAYLGIGIFIGAIFFSKGIKWLLNSYRESTIALLTGFMLGAIRSVWPFTTPMLHSQPHSFFWIACGCTALGFALVFLIEMLAKTKKLSQSL